MSMLYYFFSNQEKENAYLFEGLNVSKHQYLMLHQNQYPVIFLSLKDMKSLNYLEQIQQFAYIMKIIILQHLNLFDSPLIDESDKKTLNDL